MVVLLITEAEYMAVAHACNEDIWLKRFLGELKVKQDVVEMNCDSQKTIHLAKNLAFLSDETH